MWNKEKSVILTQAIVKSCYFLLAASVIALTILCLNYEDYKVSAIGKYYLFPFYCVVPAGYFALFFIDKLLINIKKGIIFDSHNTKFLRIISWCCFYAAVVGLISFVIISATSASDFNLTIYFTLEGIHRPVNFVRFISYPILAMGEIFMGLVLRVIKNIFEKAIEIKEENELTI